MTDSDTFDFRMLDVEELRAIHDAMCGKPKNEICAIFSKECHDMLAAHGGKLVFFRDMGTDIYFERFKPDDLREASMMFRTLAKQFKNAKKETAQKFCEMVILRCRGGLEARHQ